MLTQEEQAIQYRFVSTITMPVMYLSRRLGKRAYHRMKKGDYGKKKVKK